jgi:hypothetical protein
MNPPRLIDLVIGDVIRSVGVPTVFQFGADIPKCNAKVPHYVNSIFILIDKFLS